MKKTMKLSLLFIASFCLVSCGKTLKVVGVGFKTEYKFDFYNLNLDYIKGMNEYFIADYSIKKETYDMSRSIEFNNKDGNQTITIDLGITDEMETLYYVTALSDGTAFAQTMYIDVETDSVDVNTLKFKVQNKFVVNFVRYSKYFIDGENANISFVNFSNEVIDTITLDDNQASITIPDGTYKMRALYADSQVSDFILGESTNATLYFNHDGFVEKRIMNLVR